MALALLACASCLASARKHIQLPPKVPANSNLCDGQKVRLSSKCTEAHPTASEGTLAGETIHRPSHSRIFSPANSNLCDGQKVRLSSKCTEARRTCANCLRRYTGCTPRVRRPGSPRFFKPVLPISHTTAQSRSSEIEVSTK
eukprot:s1741_g16.t1